MQLWQSAEASFRVERACAGCHETFLGRDRTDSMNLRVTILRLSVRSCSDLRLYGALRHHLSARAMGSRRGGEQQQQQQQQWWWRRRQRLAAAAAAVAAPLVQDDWTLRIPIATATYRISVPPSKMSHGSTS